MQMSCLFNLQGREESKGGHFVHSGSCVSGKTIKESCNRDFLLCVYVCTHACLAEGGGIDMDASTDQWLEVTWNLIHSNE